MFYCIQLSIMGIQFEKLKKKIPTDQPIQVKQGRVRGNKSTKRTENAVILNYNFSLSDCHFSLIFLEGEVTSPYCQGPA